MGSVVPPDREQLQSGLSVVHAETQLGFDACLAIMAHANKSL